MFVDLHDCIEEISLQLSFQSRLISQQRIILELKLNSASSFVTAVVRAVDHIQEG